MVAKILLTLSSWNTWVQSQDTMEVMHHRWALIRAKLEFDISGEQGCPDKQRFVYEGCSPEGIRNRQTLTLLVKNFEI